MPDDTSRRMDRQRTLEFEHKDREVFALIRSISSSKKALAMMSSRRLRGVQLFIETLYAKCSTSLVSYARQSRIAELAMGGAVTERTVRNWQADAVALRILSVSRDGREKTICMDQIRAMVRTGTPENSSGTPENSSGTPENSSGTPENSSSICPVRSPRTPPPPPQTSHIRWVDPKWEEVAAALEREGYGEGTRFINQALDLGVTADVVLGAIRFYRANRDQFRGPGVLWYWLRRGELERMQLKDRPRNPDQERDRLRFRRFTELVASGKTREEAVAIADREFEREHKA